MSGVPLSTFAALLINFSATGDPDDVAQVIVWPSPSITIVIHPDGSADVDDGSDLAAIRSSLAVWSAPACTNLRLVEGPVDNERNNADDGVNRIFFLENDWPGGLSGSAAITVSRQNGGDPDTWRDADILLNGQDLEWSTTGEVQRYDIQSVVTHELGHLIGLKHAAHPEATMYFISPRGITARRTLHPIDEAAVCWLYPASGVRSCTDDAQCPLLISSSGGQSVRLTCTTGQCAPGAATARSDCLGDGQCAGNDCVRDPDASSPDDPGFCAETCSGSTCTTGDLCQNSVCWMGRDDCVGDADCPGANNVCAVDLDARRRCVHLCIEHDNCDDGEVCHGGTGQNPPGFCRVPGALGDGEVCSDGFDCISLTCAGGGLSPTCLGGAVPADDAGVADVFGADTARPDTDEPGADVSGRDSAPIVGSDASVGSDDVFGAGGDPEGEITAGCGCRQTRDDRDRGASWAMGILCALFAVIRGDRSVRRVTSSPHIRLHR